MRGRFKVDTPTPEEFAIAIPYIIGLGSGTTYSDISEPRKLAILQVGLWLKQEFQKETT